MRKEIRSVSVSTTAHIIDPIIVEAGVLKLKADQASEVAVRLAVASVDDGSATSGVLHLARDLFADFESPDPNVRTDRGDELAGFP